MCNYFLSLCIGYLPAINRSKIKKLITVTNKNCLSSICAEFDGLQISYDSSLHLWVKSHPQTTKLLERISKTASEPKSCVQKTCAKTLLSWCKYTASNFLWKLKCNMDYLRNKSTFFLTNQWPTSRAGFIVASARASSKVLTTKLGCAGPYRFSNSCENWSVPTVSSVTFSGTKEQRRIYY